ncbi:unnamed protein product [Calypogeia fissa]
MGRRNGSHTQSQSSAALSHSASTSNRRTQEDTSSYSRVITIPVDILHAGQQRLWGNKLILVFETELTSRQALDWIDAYNQEANIKFTLHDKLQNAIFVVKIEADNLEAAKKSLIHRSPFKAQEIFAAVNDYYRGFDVSNPFASADFKHLVTVYIKSGDPDTFEYLNFVVKKVGRLIRGKLASGVQSHRISALVETKQRVLPSKSSIQLEAGISTISLDYVGRNLRCALCFSYKHFESRCTISGTTAARVNEVPQTIHTAATVPHNQPPQHSTPYVRPNVRCLNSRPSTSRNNPNAAPAPQNTVLNVRNPAASGGLFEQPNHNTQNHLNTEELHPEPDNPSMTHGLEGVRNPDSSAPARRSDNPSTQHRRVDHNAFTPYQVQARQGLVGTEYWRHRAEEEQRREEEELLFEATRAVDFEVEQANRQALPNQFSPSRHISPHDVQHPGDLQGGNSQSRHSSRGAIPTIPIATAQRSSSYVNPRRPPKKSWRRTGQGHLLGSNDASCSQEAPTANDNLVLPPTLPQGIAETPVQGSSPNTGIPPLT